MRPVNMKLSLEQIDKVIAWADEIEETGIGSLSEFEIELREKFREAGKRWAVRNKVACIAQTRKGKPCQGMVVEGSLCCPSHRHIEWLVSEGEEAVS